jgi:hypothetical protein
VVGQWISPSTCRESGRLIATVPVVWTASGEE